MKKEGLLLISAFVFVAVVLFVLRFLIGGNEDTWLCSSGMWVKHGNPKDPMPDSGCGLEESTWDTQKFDEAGLVLEIPPNTVFKKEGADDNGKIRVVSFYVEKYSSEELVYQLYCVYSLMEEATSKDLDRIKTGLDPNSVKEINIDGYEGIEGLDITSGAKTHYLSVILKDGRLFSISTWPPTEDNKSLTDQIVDTFDFK